MTKPELTHAQLLAELDYCQETGIFTRGGRAVGTLHRPTGYIYISVLNRLYLAHRLAFFAVHGRWPEVTDHINGEKTDNRIANLREVTQTVNSQNRRAPSIRNQSGILGVCFDRGKWVAHISAHGKRRNLGRYDTSDAASQACVTAKRQLHAGCTI